MPVEKFVGRELLIDGKKVVLPLEKADKKLVVFSQAIKGNRKMQAYYK